MFSLDLASKLSKYNEINNHAIELVNSQQLLYRRIYSLKPIDLEIFKAYMKTNLANKFIKLFKSLTDTHILFEQKLDKFFRLCVNYRGSNNLTIKNR